MPIYGAVDQVTGKISKDEDGKPIISESKEECDEKINEKIVLENIRKNYYEIIDVLKKYMDMKEEYYPLIALWIIGTYFHKDFYSYPYLFFNAMKGSGKSRSLKLITSLSYNGNMMASPTEAVLFRTTGTLGIDEFERIGKKENSSIRELLNASYKKGIKIMRMKKKKTLGGEEHIVEEFETYRPIVLANIWGMEEVLGDRCITLILEKSNNPIITKLVEDFDFNENIQNILKRFDKCSLCSVVTKKNIYKKWNNYINEKYKTTLTTYTTYTTLTTQTTPQQFNQIKIDSLFNKIDDTKIKGRNLELFLPIFFIAFLIGDDVLKEILKIAKDLTKKKEYEEDIENIDISLIEFISKQNESLDYTSVNQLTNVFKEFLGGEEEWMNPKWFGRALKRLNLIIDKRRVGRGIEVIIDIKKAQEKMKMFKI